MQMHDVRFLEIESPLIIFYSSVINLFIIFATHAFIPITIRIGRMMGMSPSILGRALFSTASSTRLLVRVALGRVVYFIRCLRQLGTYCDYCRGTLPEALPGLSEVSTCL